MGSQKRKGDWLRWVDGKGEENGSHGSWAWAVKWGEYRLGKEHRTKGRERRRMEQKSQYPLKHNCLWGWPKVPGTHHSPVSANTCWSPVVKYSLPLMLLIQDKTTFCQLSASYLLISTLLMTLQWSRGGHMREFEFFYLQFRKLNIPNHIWKMLPKVQGHTREERTPLHLLHRTYLQRGVQQWSKGQQEK